MSPSGETKSKPFLTRLGFAWRGIRAAWSHEKSFRFQLLAAAAVQLLLLVLRPSPAWWALVTLTTASVLATELVNTALESLADAVHPEHHPLVGRAKDCAAAAVLVASLASLAVLGLLLADVLTATLTTG